MAVLFRKSKCSRTFVVDINPAKLEMARRSGADFCLNAAENVPEKLTDEGIRKPDVVFLCVDAMEHLDSSRIGVDEMITHRSCLEDIAEGFRLVLDGRESIKVIIRPYE